MKTIILLCIALVASFYSFAQDKDVYIPLYTPLSGDQYVYADTAFVRSSPALNATINDTLFVGDNITITSNEKETSTIKGIWAQWSKVHYQKGGKFRDGYIWAGLLTFNPMRRGETQFVYGLERVIESKRDGVELKDYIIGLKVVVNKQKVASYKFKLEDSESARATMAQVSTNKGLPNIKNIIALTFSGEACAIPTLTYRFGWTGEKLYQLPLETDMVDAGTVYYDEQFIFPSDKSGLADRIIMKIETGEATDKMDKKGNPIYKTTHERKVYKWDGYKVTPG